MGSLISLKIYLNRALPACSDCSGYANKVAIALTMAKRTDFVDRPLQFF